MIVVIGCHNVLIIMSSYLCFQKLHVVLFDKVFVITRIISRTGRRRYQVFRTPIPVSELILEDVETEGSKLTGSFKNAFSQGQPCK